MTTTPKNKLIRDFIPESISEEGRTPNITFLDDNKFEKEIFSKLVDESQEVMEAMEDDQEKISEEIADVLEVIDSIIKVKNLDLERIKKIQIDKKEKWGSFDKKIYLNSVTEKE